MGILNWLASRKERSTSADSLGDLREEDSFDGLSTTEIVSRLQKISESGHAPFGILQKARRRLTEIAFHDHHISDDDRELAYQVSKKLRDDLVAAMQQNPDALRAFQDIEKNEWERRRVLGIGSISWMMEEQNIPAGEVVAFALKKEHSHLLRNFFVGVGEEAFSRARPEMVAELLRTRSKDFRTPNCVLIAYSLAIGRDHAVEALFSPEELGVLRRACDDYSSARQFLASLGILSTTVPRHPLPNPTGSFKEFTFLTLASHFKGEEDSSAVLEYLSSVSDEWRQAFRIAQLVTGVHIAIAHIGAMFGGDSKNELRQYILQEMQQSREMGLETLLLIVDNAEIVAFGENGRVRVGPDWMLFDHVLHSDKPEQTEGEYEEVKSNLFLGAELLTRHRANLLAQLRFIVRHGNRAPSNSDANDASLPSGDKIFWEDAMGT